MPEPVRVFVSYASQDRPFAQRLVNDLKAAGAEVWWDVSGINEGDFLKRINEALQKCEWCVLILTPHAIASEWVEMEVNAAIHLRKQRLLKGVLPVLAAQVEAAAIPPLWGNLHRYDGIGNCASEVQCLQATIGLPPKIVPEKPQPANTPSIFVAPVSPPVSSRPPWLTDHLLQLGFTVGAQGSVWYIVPPVVAVPAGAFLVGSVRKKDKNANKNESPQHSVTLAAYQIGKFPVTVAECACFVRATGRVSPNGQDSVSYQVSLQKEPYRLDRPVVQMIWQDAIANARWLSECAGEQWRLPSEAEWEKAARGTDGRIYPWGDQFDAKKTNTWEGGIKGVTPVGSHPTGASPYGVQDMAGNVWELTSSVFKPYPYRPTDGRERAESTEDRVVRGSSWEYGVGAERTRAAYRQTRHYAGSFVGFGLARSVTSS